MNDWKLEIGGYEQQDGDEVVDIPGVDDWRVQVVGRLDLLGMERGMHDTRKTWIAAKLELDRAIQEEKDDESQLADIAKELKEAMKEEITGAIKVLGRCTKEERTEVVAKVMQGSRQYCVALQNLEVSKRTRAKAKVELDIAHGNWEDARKVHSGRRSLVDFYGTVAYVPVDEVSAQNGQRASRETENFVETFSDPGTWTSPVTRLFLQALPEGVDEEDDRVKDIINGIGDALGGAEVPPSPGQVPVASL